MLYMKRFLATFFATVFAFMLAGCELVAVPEGSVELDGSDTAKITIPDTAIPNILNALKIDEVVVDSKSSSNRNSDNSKNEKSGDNEPTTDKDKAAEENDTSTLKQPFSGGDKYSDQQLDSSCNKISKTASVDYKLSGRSCVFGVKVPKFKPDEEGKIDLDAYAGNIYTSLINGDNKNTDSGENEESNKTNNTNDGGEMDIYDAVNTIRSKVYLTEKSDEQGTEITVNYPVKSLSPNLEDAAYKATDSGFSFQVVVTDKPSEKQVRARGLWFTSGKKEGSVAPTVSEKPKPKGTKKAPAKQEKSGLSMGTLALFGGLGVMILGMVYVVIKKKQGDDDSDDFYTPPSQPQMPVQAPIQQQAPQPTRVENSGFNRQGNSAEGAFSNMLDEMNEW